MSVTITDPTSGHSVPAPGGIYDVTGDHSGENSVQGWLIRSGQNDLSVTDPNPTNPGGDGTFSLHFTGITPGSGYTVRARGVTTGLGDREAPVTFTAAFGDHGRPPIAIRFPDAGETIHLTKTGSFIARGTHRNLRALEAVLIRLDKRRSRKPVPDKLGELVRFTKRTWRFKFTDLDDFVGGKLLLHVYAIPPDTSNASDSATDLTLEG